MKKKIIKETNDLINSTSNIVIKAANILEQNIAEGILMAQKVENKFINPKDLREDKELLTNKFRQNTHDALDILFDALTLASAKIQDFTTQMEKLADTKTSSTQREIPVVSLDQPISPGENVLIPLTLQNESNTEEMKVEFYDQGLKSSSEANIHTRNITYEPKVLTIKPGKKETLQIKVYIPKTATAGEYTGIIQAKSIPELEAILKIQVS